MTFIDDAGKEVFTDEDLEMLEKSGYDTEKMTDEELSNAYNKESEAKKYRILIYKEQNE